MASWYVGSVQYTAISVWTSLTTLAVGAIRRQTAPTEANERAFRVSAITTGITGASEPSWNVNKGSTTADSGVTWTEVTGNSTYGWNAAAPYLSLVLNVSWANAGDTFYVASNHSFTTGSSISWGLGNTASDTTVVCVNPAGSVPPVAADVTTGALETSSVGFSLNSSAYIYGITFGVTGFGTLTFGSSNICRIVACVVKSSERVVMSGGGSGGTILWENTTFNAASTSSGISISRMNFTWRNTASALPGSIPTVLFRPTDLCTITVEGVDLSAFTGTVLDNFGVGGIQVNFVNCKLNASFTYMSSRSIDTYIDTIISASSGVGYTQERHNIHADLTTETTIVRSTGATDGVTPISWKVVTLSTNCWSFPFVAFPVSQWVAAGSSLTCTVATLTDGVTLTNSDIWMEVEVLDSSGAPLAAPHSSGRANPLTVASNLTTDGTSSWTTTGISSPVKQYMQVTFTPQIAGYVRAWIYVGKVSQTLYIDPLLQIV